MIKSTVNPPTLVDLLHQRSHAQSNQKLYTFLLDGETDEQHLTYQQLDQQARAIGAELQNLGAVGERVLLLYPPGLEYIAGFFGCLYAGAVAVPAYPPDPTRLNKTLPRLQAIVNDAQPLVTLTTSPILMMAKALLGQDSDLWKTHWLATDDVDSDLAEAWQTPALSSDTLALLQYTSGSTAAPKGVMISHGNLLHNERIIQEAFEHTEQDIVVGWLPVYHDMGLIGNVLQPLYLGVPCILMSPIDFLKRPLRWLQAISRYRATTSGGPNFAYDLCVRKVTAEQRMALDLSSWSIAFNGAEPVRHATMERFAEAFAPCGFRKAAFYPCYGLAEATLIVSGGAKAAPPVTQRIDRSALAQDRVEEVAPTSVEAQTLVGCGHTLVDQRIVIADPHTLRASPPGQVGEIWVSGPSVAQGYWGRSEDTQTTFQAQLADTGEGPFLRTGDLGFLQDKELFITGRIKDLIIIRGRNHYPQDIERTVEQSHPALRPGCGAAFSVDVADQEQLVIAQEIRREATDPEKEAIIQAIRQAVARRHELHIHSVLLLQPRSIPKTSSGKIQRHACRAGFLAGNLDTVAESVLDAASDEPPAVEPEESFIREALTAVDDPAARRSLLTLYLRKEMARILRLSSAQIDVQQPVSALGFDSLKVVELQHSIETDLGVIVPMVELFQGASLSQLVPNILAEFETPADTSPVLLASAQEPSDEHPLSHGQRALWFLHRLAPESAAYNIASAVRIEGELDVPALRRTFQKLVDRHPSLRTTFPILHGEPVQHVHDQVQVDFNVEDASTWPEASLDERLAEEAHRPFDLEGGPLLRVYLFRRAAQAHVLLLVVHHIVADFWSLAVLVRDLETLYPAEKAGTLLMPAPLTLRYSDYTRWQADILASPKGERLWAYWKQQLAGELPALNLPTDRPRPAVQTYRGASQTLRLSPKLTEGLKALGRAHGATLYMTLLGAFQVLLHRYTGQDDILVGSPTAGRNRAELAGLIGYFINPVPLRADLSGNPSFAAILDQVRQTVLAAFEHQDYAFDLLVERLQPERDTARSPIFQAMFILQQTPPFGKEGLAAFALGETGAQIDLGELSLESVALEQRAAQFDLTLAVAELAGGLGVSLQHNSDLFEAASIERMLRNFQALLEGIVAHPERRVAALPLLTAEERQQVLVMWNDTGIDYPHTQGRCIHELFEAQAERALDRVAVVFEDEHLTYRELNRQANRLAHHLRELGVGAETRVGIWVERSLEMVVGLLGTLKAGGTFVPLDPAHPVERNTLVLEDAQVAVLLTQARLVENLPVREAQVVCLDADWELIARQSEANATRLVNPQNLAYVIYTSGSTGKPKGVQVLHRAVVNFLDSMRQQPGLTDQDVLLAVTTLSFDIASLELFLPLTTGARVVLASQEVAGDGTRLSTQLVNSGATVMQATPATWRLLLEIGWSGNRRLKILCGGEAFPRELADRLVEMCAGLWNMYGPTETTIWSAIHPVAGGVGPVPIGRPIANTQFYLLDAHLQPVPVGVPGALYIGGDGLARGYFNRPALTADKFVPHPFDAEPGARLYNTGDLARYLPDGSVEFLGRSDYQVKIRGFRIELGEIEAALSQHPAVQETVVMAREDTPGDKRLVAYVVPGRESAPTVSELRRFLREKLPEYMVPSAFEMLESWPLTPNGKINRRALPAPEGLRPKLEAAYVMPQTQLEKRVAAVWQSVLQVEKVGVHDNFFDLGGHSLLMARIHSLLQAESLDDGLSMVELFQYPTIHSLAKYLSTRETSELDRERVEIRSAGQSAMQRQKERRRKARSRR